MKEKTKN